MVFQKIAVIGGSGKIGKHIVPLLLQSQDPIFEVSVLSHSGEVDGLSNRVKFHKVDYDNHTSLVTVLKGIDVIVSTLPVTVSAKIEHQLAAAGEEAGVRRIFPSEYTLDLLHPHARAIFADSDPRIPSYEQFVADADKGGMSFTYVIPGGFLDYVLAGYIGTVDVRARESTVVDGGVHRATGCTTEFIAACVVAALKMPEEETKNQRIRVAEVEYTGLEMVEVLEKVTGYKFTVTNVTTEQLLENVREAKQKGDWRAAYVNMVLRVNFDGKGAALLTEGLEWNAGGKLQAKRKTLLEMAQDVVAGL